MDDLFLLSGYLGAFAIILAVGGFIADYIFPHIPIIENWLNGLPDYEDEREDSKIIDFPGEYTGECWGIWAVRSANSIFGAAESWVYVRGDILTFPTFPAAAEAADAYNINIGTENLCYTPKAI